MKRMKSLSSNLHSLQSLSRKLRNRSSRVRDPTARRSRTGSAQFYTFLYYKKQGVAAHRLPHVFTGLIGRLRQWRYA